MQSKLAITKTIQSAQTRTSRTRLLTATYGSSLKIKLKF